MWSRGLLRMPYLPASAPSLLDKTAASRCPSVPRLHGIGITAASAGSPDLQAMFLMCGFCAAQVPAAAVPAVPDLAQPQVDAHADTAAVAGATCPAPQPPELPSAVAHTVSGSQSAWSDEQLCARQPVAYQHDSNGATAASSAYGSERCAPSPPAHYTSWTTSSLYIPGRQLPPEAAAHVVLDISGPGWDQHCDQPAARPGPESGALPQSSGQNLGCMPAPPGQKLKRLQQKQSPSPGVSHSGPQSQLEHSAGRCCSDDGLAADSLLCRAPSRDSVLSFEALATRSHTSGLDLSTVCWLISGHPD